MICLLLVTFIEWNDLVSEVHWRPVYMIYLESQLQDSVPPSNAEEKDLQYSRRFDSQILVKSTDLAEISHT